MARKELSEHLLVIVVSIALCAVGVYIWHHVKIKSEWVEEHPSKPAVDQPPTAGKFLVDADLQPAGHLQHRLELSAWTPEDTQQFKECVMEHLLDWKHYMLGSRALVLQVLEVAGGKVCSSKLPPTDELSRMRLLGSPNFLTPEECNRLRTKFKPTMVSPDGKTLEQSPAALPFCILSPSGLREWDGLLKQGVGLELPVSPAQ
jgi:hypothetical protein